MSVKYAERARSSVRTEHRTFKPAAKEIRGSRVQFPSGPLSPFLVPNKNHVAFFPPNDQTMQKIVEESYLQGHYS